jgi:hypothetical protein
MLLEIILKDKILFLSRSLDYLIGIIDAQIFGQSF